MADKPKQASGYQKRKAKREREKAETVAQARALGVPLADVSDDGAAEFTAIGDPPLDDPDTALAWIRRNQLVAFRLGTTRPLTDGLRERIKLARELGFAIGSSQNRTDVEERLETVETLIANVKPHGAIQTTEAHGHARAATSRGGGAARRLRTVPGHAPGPRGISSDGQPPHPPDGRDDPDGGGTVG